MKAKGVINFAFILTLITVCHIPNIRSGNFFWQGFFVNFTKKKSLIYH